MYVCKNCGQQYPQYIKFCGKCGGEVEDNSQPQANYQNQVNPYDQTMQTTTPVYSSQPNPAYQPVTYANPESGSAPVMSGSSKAKGIIGMILGIESLIGSLILFIMSFVALAYSSEANSSYYDYYDYYYYDYYDITSAAESFAVGVLFIAIVHLAFAIVGMCLSSSARNSGFISGVTKTGKILSIIALVFSAIASFLSIIALAMVA